MMIYKNKKGEEFHSSGVSANADRLVPARTAVTQAVFKANLKRFAQSQRTIGKMKRMAAKAKRDSQKQERLRILTNQLTFLTEALKRSRTGE